MSKRGFMLVEALIVVAVVGIMALCAFAWQQRSAQNCAYAAVKEELRTTAVALGAYDVDFGALPPTWITRDGYGSTRSADTLALPILISTPIAYLQQTPIDCYKVGQNITGSAGSRGRPYESGDRLDLSFLYVNIQFEQQRQFGGTIFFSPAHAAAAAAVHGRYWMASIGPAQNYAQSVSGLSVYTTVNAIYDPTNGTISQGLVVHNAFSSLEPPPPPAADGVMTY
ncbi:hypothetical protein GC173_00215 [bacterium]|nr:hypothetical protein [bacterium]